MLLRELDPLLDLPLAPPIVDLALETEREDVGGIEVQDLLQLRECERIFVLLVARPGAVEKLRDGPLPARSGRFASGAA